MVWLATLLIAAPSPAGAAEPPVGAFLAAVSGLRVRAEPSIGADVVESLERGRWVEVEAWGEEEELDGHRARWARVRDPFGLRAPPASVQTEEEVGASLGWVWGGMLQPLPAGLPAVDSSRWARALVRTSGVGRGDPGTVLWTYRTIEADGAEGLSLELSTWSSKTKQEPVSRVFSGWGAVEAVHWKDVGGGELWLWLVGQGTNGDRKGMLLDGTAGQSAWLDVVLEHQSREGLATVSEFLLLDLDGDGMDEAVVLAVDRGRQSQVRGRRFSAYGLNSSTGWRPLEGVDASEDGLLPPPDLRVGAVELGRSRGVLIASVRVDNLGALAPATRLRLRVAPRHRGDRPGSWKKARKQTERWLELPPLVAGRSIEVEVPLPRGRSVVAAQVEAVVVPTGVEESLTNNRLVVRVDLLASH